jgi:putative flippase GtrA
MGRFTSYLKNSFIWQSRFLRVAILGGTGVLVQTAIFETIAFWLKLVAPSTAVIISAEFGILTSFFLNNRFAFDGHRQQSLCVRLLRFHIVVIGSLIIQWLFVFTAEHLTASTLFIQGAYFAGVLTGFVSNYIGYSLWVWRHNESLPDTVG